MRVSHTTGLTTINIEYNLAGFETYFISMLLEWRVIRKRSVNGSMANIQPRP
jgi:hypothetical protein